VRACVRMHVCKFPVHALGLLPHGVEGQACVAMSARQPAQLTHMVNHICAAASSLLYRHGQTSPSRYTPRGSGTYVRQCARPTTHAACYVHGSRGGAPDKKHLAMSCVTMVSGLAASMAK